MASEPRTSKFRVSLGAYKGAGLILVTAIVAVWLAATGQLELYIHPRYIIFTVVFAVIAVLMVVYGSKYGTADEPHGDGVVNHADRTVAVATTSPARRRLSYIMAISASVICLFAALALLVTRPVPLTSSTATQRGINAAAAATTENRQPVESPLFSNNDYSSFKISDWVGLLVQTDDPDFFVGKNVSVVGFVVADATDRDIFYVSRFVVTCCAVDARPIGLAVHSPGWQSKLNQDDWVEVSGAFVSNPSSLNFEVAVIEPTGLEKTTQPERVYDF